jgi:hypothetical protein
MSDVIVLKVEGQKNTYTRAIWSKNLAESNDSLRIWDKPCVKVHDTLTRLEYKEDNGDEFLKCKVRL